MLTTDHDLRDALAPLREVEPADDALARALAAADAPRARPGTPIRSRALRPALVLGATGVIAAGVAALPSGPAGRSDAGTLLRAAAATAADARTAPVSAYRWSAVRETLTYRDRSRDGREAATTFTQRAERWIDRSGRGAVRRGPVSGLRRSGDAVLLRLQPTSSGPSGTARLQVGDAPVSATDGVPADAAEARRFLDRRIAAAYGGRALPAEQVRWERTRQVVDLLGSAALRPGQRSALWGVLASTDGVQSPGVQGDALGRRGPAVTIGFPGGVVRRADGVPVTLPEGTLRVVFDPGTAALLESSFLHDGTDGNAGTPDRIDVYEDAGWVGAPGERPGRR